MALFPKWFLFDESPADRNLRHAALRKQMADKEYRDRLAAEAKQLADEAREDAKDKRKGKGRHRK